MSRSFLSRQNIGTPVGRFWFHTGMLSSLIEMMDVGIHTDPTKVFDAFQASEPEKQNAFLKKVSFYVRLIEGAIEEGISILEDKGFVVFTMNRLGLEPPPDLLDQIEVGDYIELYDPTGVQIFANLEFCAQISYSIEETFMFNFDELYKRDDKYLQPLMDAFQNCFTTAEGPFSPGVKAHYVEEIFSPDKKRALVLPKVFCPLRGKSGQVEAMLSCLKIEDIR